VDPHLRQFCIYRAESLSPSGIQGMFPIVKLFFQNSSGGQTLWNQD